MTSALLSQLPGDLSTALMAVGVRGPSAVELFRLGIAFLALPLLFRALRDERVDPENPKAATRDLARRCLFAALGAWVLFLLTARVEGPAAGDKNDPGRGFQYFSTGVLNYHLRHSRVKDSLALTDELYPRRARRKTHAAARPSGNPVEDLRTAADLVPDSATMQRYFGVALAEKGDLPAARWRLDRAVEALRKRAPQRAEAEQAVWRTLFGPKLPTPAEIDGARRTLDGFGLGWLGHVAALSAYQRLGGDAPPAELRALVTREANQYCANLILGGICNLLLLSQLGLVCLGVGIALAASGVLRPAPQAFHPVSAPLWESFILMFLCGMLARPLTGGIRVGAPETQPGMWAAVLIIGDLFQLLALVYLWLRLRARGLTLAEVGLTRRHLGANIAIGVMAALVLMPSAALINIVTDWLTHMIVPNAPPPYHPLGGMTAGSTSPAIRWALWGTAAVGAPLIEETFFRGALFGALRRRSRFWVALLGSSAFFAILHPQLPLGFLPIALLGAGFACLYEWRQSLVPGMVAHAVNNSIAFMMMSLIFPLRG